MNKILLRCLINCLSSASIAITNLRLQYRVQDCIILSFYHIDFQPKQSRVLFYVSRQLWSTDTNVKYGTRLMQYLLRVVTDEKCINACAEKPPRLVRSKIRLGWKKKSLSFQIAHCQSSNFGQSRNGTTVSARRIYQRHTNKNKRNTVVYYADKYKQRRI